MAQGTSTIYWTRESLPRAIAVKRWPELRIPPAMHVATVIMRVKDDKRSEAMSAIDGFIGRMHTVPGCLTCRLMADTGDSQLLTLVSEWDSREALDGFLSSREFLILQGMRMVLRDDPQVILDEILLRSRMSLGARSR
jgi:quinol monooxygenase YgiN